MPIQRSFFKNFGGGINDNTPATQLKDNQIVEALNFEFDKQNNLRSRQGVNKFNPNRNLLIRTEEFDNAAWVKEAGITVFADNNLSPIGDMTAEFVVSNIGTPKKAIYQDITGVQNNAFYTGSVYLAYNVGGGETSLYPIPAEIKFEFSGGTPKSGLLKFQIVGTNFVVTANTLDGYTLEYIPPLTPVSPTSIFYIRVSGTLQNNNTGNTTLRFKIYPNNEDYTGTNYGLYVWGAQLERGKKPSKYFKNVATASTDLNVASRFTSIHQFNKEDGTNGIFATAGSKIYRYDPSTQALVDATGGLTLPSDTYWQWVTYLDTAIGVNRGNTASGATNPVKITSVTGSAAALGGSPPKGLYIEVWNSRVWIVNADDPSSIKCSALGLPENYTNTGKSGSQSFEIGAEITGIKATKDRFFIFTKNSIYYMMPGSPNTDIEQYELKLLSAKIGCLSAYSIQVVLDDIIFLSNFGLASIAAVQDFGDFESAILSKNISDLNNFQMAADNSASVVYSSKSQYYLAAPLGVNSTHNKCFILDFTGIQEKEVGFTTADGILLGACFAEIIFNNKRRMLIGGYPDSTNENLAFIYIADEPNVFNDDTVAYTQRVKTKAYDVDAFVTNKVFTRTLFEINLLTSTVSLNWSYRINEKIELTKTWPMAFVDTVLGGAVYDVDKYDQARFAYTSSPFRTAQRRIVGDPGRIGQSIQFILEITGKDIGIVLKGYGFDFKPITSRRLIGG